MTKQLQFKQTTFFMTDDFLFGGKEFSAGACSDQFLDGLPWQPSLQPLIAHQKFSICIVAKHLFPTVL